MKVNCEYCQQNMKTKVREPMDKFHIGRVICPNCNKENKRYISEFDLLLYFVVSSIFYFVAVYLAFYILDNIFFDNVLLGMVLFTLLLVVGYFYTDNVAKFIYFRAPYKSEWRNHVFKKEEQLPIARRLNFQFIILIVVSFAIGTQDDKVYLYSLAMVALIVFNAIKAYLQLKNERNEARK